MERLIRIKRLYSLGDYRNIEFEDFFSNIPDPLLFDDKFTSEAYYLLLVNIELAYRRYINLAAKYPHGMAVEEAIKGLEMERENTLKTLKAIINGTMEA